MIVEENNKLKEVSRCTHLATDELLPILEGFIGSFSDFVIWYEETIEDLSMLGDTLCEFQEKFNKLMELAEKERSDTRKMLIEPQD